MPLFRLTDEPMAIIGDDLPYNTIRYEDVPDGFRIADALAIVMQSEAPGLVELRTVLAERLDLHFKQWEIVGDTIADFYDRLVDTVNMHTDTIERLIQVYHDDIAKPTMARTETVTYGAENQPLTTTVTHTDTEVRSSESLHFDVPIYGTESNPSLKDTAKSKVDSGTIVDSSTQTGVVTTHLSDIGVKPNYEILNGFLDENRTLLQVIAGFLKPCFTLHRTMRW